MWVTGSHYQHPMFANGRIEQWVAPLCGGRIDLKTLLELGRRQINEVLFEAGNLLGSLIESRLVDQEFYITRQNSLGRLRDPCMISPPLNWLMRKRSVFRGSVRWVEIFA